MSEQYISTDGYKPLLLPANGEDLVSGRQYYLSPVARVCIEEMYGLRGVPSIVECLLARRPAGIIRTIRTNLDRSVTLYDREVVLGEQDATFRAFVKNRMHYKFTVDLEKVHAMEPFYAEADRVSDYAEADTKGPKVPKVDRTPDLSLLDL